VQQPPRRVGLIGVPTSAGAFAPGQEQAPAALRAAGLAEQLRSRGLEHRDHGDRERWRWRPDREHPGAQNAEAVAEIVADTSARVAAAAAAGEFTLVLGGDCTVGIGTVAGHVGAGDRVGLLYFDTHADLNIPDSVPEGALDWMGMAHMLALEGAEPAVAGAGRCVPLLQPEQVVLFGWGPQQATAFERTQIERLRLSTVPVDEVAQAPEHAAQRALALLSEFERIIVHFDVDVIDFTDVPLSENTGRNEGLKYAAALRALAALLSSPAVAGVTVTELNPDHVEEGAGTLERFAADLAAALAADGV
jgi:arginase